MINVAFNSLVREKKGRSAEGRKDRRVPSSKRSAPIPSSYSLKPTLIVTVESQ